MNVHYYIVAAAIHKSGFFASCRSTPIIYKTIRIDTTQSILRLTNLFEINKFTTEDLNNILSVHIISDEDAKSFEVIHAINHVRAQTNINKIYSANKKYDNLKEKYEKLQNDYQELEKKLIKNKLDDDDLYERIHLQAKKQSSVFDDSFEEFNFESKDKI